MNLIDGCIDKGVKRVIALSTDKKPLQTYMVRLNLLQTGYLSRNSYSGDHDTRFSVVRYGNVMGSRGSIILSFNLFRGSFFANNR